MEDRKKIKYNLIVGILSQVVALLLGIIVPKLILVNYGSEINGLLSSVTNIYAYIAIVEAGIAATSCQALYKPIVHNDREGANSILAATNRYYRRTGIIYLGLIVLFSTLYPVLVKTDISYFTVFFVILFNGLGNVVNYFFHGKYLILLKADGKNFVRTGLETVINVLKQGSKILLISLGYNVIFVQLAVMLVSFVQMIYITYYIKKHYSWIDLSVEPNTASISQSKHVLVHEINFLITSNVDTVILTIFKSLKIVSVYSMYNLLFSTINRVLRAIRDALEFKIAHAFHKDKDAFMQMFRAFEVYYISFTFALFSIANYFILPFMSLYTKGVTDINYLEKYIPILFVMINIISAVRYPSEALIHIAGHFKLTQNSAIIESVINIVVSLSLVYHFGIIGVLIGTIISLLYRTNYLIVYVNKKIVGRSCGSTYLCWGINLAVFAVNLFINQFVNIRLDSYMRIFVFCIPYAVCVIAFHFVAASLAAPQAFRYVLKIVKRTAKSQ